MLIDTKELLKPPVGRAAYSDRTAWLMAEMSRLAYLKFEGPAAVRESLVEDLAKLTDKTAIEAKLQEVEQLLLSSGDQRDALESELREADFNLVKTFNSRDTQAILATREKPERVAILAFRGTDASFGDIKADLNARFFSRGTQKIHNGFLKAFQVVESRIRSALRDLPDHKLYITGHYCPVKSRIESAG
jgi:triacylglycerol lipase